VQERKVLEAKKRVSAASDACTCARSDLRLAELSLKYANVQLNQLQAKHQLATENLENSVFAFVETSKTHGDCRVEAGAGIQTGSDSLEACTALCSTLRQEIVAAKAEVLSCQLKENTERSKQTQAEEALAEARRQLGFAEDVKQQALAAADFVAARTKHVHLLLYNMFPTGKSFFMERLVKAKADLTRSCSETNFVWTGKRVLCF
jgi:hypothetical protein